MPFHKKKNGNNDKSDLSSQIRIEKMKRDKLRLQAQLKVIKAQNLQLQRSVSPTRKRRFARGVKGIVEFEKRQAKLRKAERFLLGPKRKRRSRRRSSVSKRAKSRSTFG